MQSFFMSVLRIAAVMVTNLFCDEIWLTWLHLEEDILIAANISSIIDGVASLERHAAQKTLAYTIDFVLHLIAEKTSIRFHSLCHFDARQEPFIMIVYWSTNRAIFFWSSGAMPC